MSGDSVTRAADALRERHTGVATAAAETRRAILTAARRRGHRRRAAVLVVAPLAAVLALSTAWAAVTGRLPGWLAAAPRGERSSPALGRPRSTPTTAPASAPPESAPESEPESASARAPASAPQSAPAPAPAPASARAPAPAPASASSPVSASAPLRTITQHPKPTPARELPPASDSEGALFAEAHRAHFVDRNPNAALSAWNAYLAAYPNGRFALEARYNRALSLARLGRNNEARDALAPFVDGRFGGYRQKEARELVDVLDGGP